MKILLLVVSLLWAVNVHGDDGSVSTSGVASWYGEAHRGKPMANRKKFDPDKLTAASWFYPLGTRVRVTLQSEPQRAVIVTITDRGSGIPDELRAKIFDPYFTTKPTGTGLGLAISYSIVKKHGGLLLRRRHLARARIGARPPCTPDGHRRDATGK